MVWRNDPRSTRGAGPLSHKVGFFKRSVTDDGYGNERTAFSDTPEFEAHAGVRAKFGGETVLADRLEGNQICTITVRQSSRFDQVTSEWMAKDMREGTIWSIRSGPVDPDDGGAYYEFLCQTGVAP
jgi:hypothetical protein